MIEMPPPPAPGTNRRADIISAARGWIGTPYRHQASLKGQGADCLGLLRGVWRECLGPEPEAFQPYGPGWAELGSEERLLALAARHLALIGEADFKPANILIFRWRANLPAQHCGIVTTPGRFIHAHDGASVAEVALIAGWRRRIVAVFDFPSLVD